MRRDMFGPGTEESQRTVGPSDVRLPLRHHYGHFVGAGANDVGAPAVSAVHKNPICERSLSPPPLSRVLTRAALGRQRLRRSLA